ncbi:nuclear transport factor 2 family protein [Streptomyces sp. NPDC060194]|uniref:nuclear transport factor 2 family protein n=1 Tax=Streptomyces sp. NPDC060194 TaxID=3347069 RepID=UPI003650205A
MTTQQSNPADVAAAYFTAWQAKDIDAYRALLAGDVTFVGPLGTADGAEEAVKGFTGLAGITTKVDVKKVFADGADVLTWFVLHTTVADPVPVANWTRVVDGRITRIRVAFDASGFRR